MTRRCPLCSPWARRGVTHLARSLRRLVAGAHGVGTPANLDADLDTILGSCFAYEPRDRATAEFVAARLRSALEQHNQPGLAGTAASDDGCGPSVGTQSTAATLSDAAARARWKERLPGENLAAATACTGPMAVATTSTSWVCDGCQFTSKYNPLECEQCGAPNDA